MTTLVQRRVNLQRLLNQNIKDRETLEQISYLVEEVERLAIEHGRNKYYLQVHEHFSEEVQRAVALAS